MESELYATATDTLIDLHRHAPPTNLASYDCTMMADMAALAFDWYAAAIGVSDADLRDLFHAEMRNALTQHTGDAHVLIQRDYHAENLLWLPDRSGVGRVGLLDFQDALVGHCAYDLVSLLQDARRDVPAHIETAMIRRYVDIVGIDSRRFDAAYHCLGTQRNLRILGVFTRLCLRDGKSGYIDLIPRVWNHLQRDLAHPAVSKINNLLQEKLPPPTPETLKAIREKCATPPAQ